MRKKAILGYVLAYIMWIVSMLLCLLFLVMGRTTFPVIIGSLMAESDFDARQWAIVIDRIFTLVVGMGLVFNMVVVENYFRTGVKSGDLVRRLARVFGILLLLLFLADGAQQLILLSVTIVWTRVALLFLELIAGLFLLIYSYRARPKKRTGMENITAK